MFPKPLTCLARNRGKERLGDTGTKPIRRKTSAKERPELPGNGRSGILCGREMSGPSCGFEHYAARLGSWRRRFSYVCTGRIQAGFYWRERVRSGLAATRNRGVYWVVRPGQGIKADRSNGSVRTRFGEESENHLIVPRRVIDVHSAKDFCIWLRSV